VAVVETALNPAELHSIDALSRQRLDEIEHFFVSYNEAEGRKFKPVAGCGAKHAERLLQDVIREAASCPSN
jgi:inorganic pyrophosphatase